MKPHLLAAAALAAMSAIANAQSSGSDTATPAIPNAGAPPGAFTTPAVPGDPATRATPNVPATPSPPSTPVDVPPGSHDMGKTGQTCNGLSDASVRKDCMMHSIAGSSSSGAGMPGRNSDPRASPGTGSASGDAGKSTDEARVPKGPEAAADTGSSSASSPRSQ